MDSKNGTAKRGKGRRHEIPGKGGEQPLPERQEQLARAWVARDPANPETQTAIAKRLGWTRHGVSKALNSPSVMARIDVLRGHAMRRTELSGDRVIQRLWRECDATDERNDQPSARVRALELLGRHLGVLTEAPAVAVQVVIDRPLSTSEWAAHFGASHQQPNPEPTDVTPGEAPAQEQG